MTDVRKVVLWMGVAIVSFTAMAVSLRQLSPFLSVFEAMAVRNAFGVLLLMAIAWRIPRLRPELRIRSIRLNLLRNVFQFGGQSAWSLAMVSLPLATAFALEFATPVITVVLAIWFLGEGLNRHRAAAIGVGAAGISLVLAPQLATLGWSMALPLLAALGFALSDIVTKRLTSTQTAFSILFAMSLMQLPMNLAFSDPTFATRISPDALLPLLVLCIAGSAGHYGLTKALSYGEAIIVVPIDFVRLPLAAAIGMVFYAEFPSPLVLAGGAILLGAVFINLHGETRRPRIEGGRPRSGQDREILSESEG